MDGTKLVNDLIEITSRLIDVMNREIDYLRAMRPQEIKPLQAEKQDLVRAYEEMMTGLAAKREPFDAVAPALKEELVAVSERLQAVVRDNEHALRAAGEANRRLIAAVVEAVKQKETEAKAYSRTGTLESGRKGAPGRAVPLSVDHRL